MASLALVELWQAGFAFAGFPLAGFWALSVGVVFDVDGIGISMSFATGECHFVLRQRGPLA